MIGCRLNCVHIEIESAIKSVTTNWVASHVNVSQSKGDCNIPCVFTEADHMQTVIDTEFEIEKPTRAQTLDPCSKQ